MSDNEEVGWLLVDMNSYFASVEQEIHPHLRGKPVAVVPMKNNSTCCIAASYEAKAFGVKTGTNVGEAKKMCPGLILVDGDHEKYIYYHHKIIAAVENCHPVTQILSIDEMACRLGGRDRKVDKAVALGKEIKASILSVGSQLKCSVGLAPNRFLAKLASDMQKPNGLTVLRKSDLPEKILPLKLRDLCGVGHAMERRLYQAGIKTMQDLWALSAAEMARVWGGIGGEQYYRWLRGEDFLLDHKSHKTIGHSHVLPPQARNDTGASAVIQKLLYKAGVRMRKLDFWAQRMSLSIRYADHKKWGMEIKMTECQDDLSLRCALKLLWQERPSGRPLKVSVVLYDFIHNADRTLTFFENTRGLQLTKALDKLNSRYGKQTVYFGGWHEAKRAAPMRVAFTNIPDPEV
jgi:DNA polymerase IV